MLTEQSHSEPNWKLLPGTILDGGYEMEELLQADEKRARFKIRVLGDRTIEAVASFFPLRGTAAEEQVEAWNILRTAPHPNISKPLASGKKVVDGVELVYIIVRRADETLSSALAERALTPGEAGEVVLSCARALEYLEQQGLVPDGISPKDVLAVDDAIQLSPDRIRVLGSSVTFAGPNEYVAPESVGAGATGPAAVWCLGATLFETLTQKTYDESRREEAGNLPLGWIMDRCLSESPTSRCKPEEIPSLLQSGPPPKPIAQQTASAATPAPNALDVETAPDLRGEKTALPVSLTAAAAAAGNGSPVSPVTGAPISANRVEGESAKPAALESSAAKPAITSVSQARTKVLKESEFDVLTSPQSLNRTPTAKASSAAAAAGTFSAPAQMPPSGNGTALRRVPATGSKPPSVPPVTSRPRPLSESPIASASSEFSSSSRRLDMDRESVAGPNWTRLVIYLAAAVAVILLLIWVMRSKPARIASVSSPPASSSTTQTNPAPSNPAAIDNSAANKVWPTRTLQPDQSAVSSPARTVSSAAAPAASAAPTSGTAIWRVVVFTYNRQEDAASKAQKLNAKHPRLQAQVFSPNGHSGPYLVTVGGRMTREEAARFRSRSLSLGLPRDSYIQNYKP